MSKYRKLLLGDPAPLFRSVSRLFGAIRLDSMPGDEDYLARRFWLLLDPACVVVALIPFAGDGSEQSQVSMHCHFSVCPRGRWTPLCPAHGNLHHEHHR